MFTIFRFCRTIFDRDSKQGLYDFNLISRIRHNNKGGFAPWFLESVTIEDTSEGSKSLLQANRWLDKKTSLQTVLYLQGV